MNRGTGTVSSTTPPPLKSKAAQATDMVTHGANRAWHFMDGTIRGTLDFCARYGRRGLYVGALAGAALMFFPAMAATLPMTGLALPFYGALAGAVAGAALGALRGALTGGAERLALEDRKVKYADELEERRQARSFDPRRRASKREYDQAQDFVDRINYDKYDQYIEMRERQNQTGGNNSWAERVDGSRSNFNGLGR